MSSKSGNVVDVIIADTFIEPAAGDVDVTALTAGEAVAFNQDRDGAFANSFSLQFAQFDSDNGSRLSLAIPIKRIQRVTKVAYAAATAQAITLTVAAGDVANNTVYAIYLVHQNDPEYVNKWRKRYEYVSDSSATATEIAAGLAAAINADPSRNKGGVMWEASDLAGVLTVTAVGDRLTPAYRVVTTLVAASGFTSASTIATTVKADPGNGTYDIVKAIEDWYKGYKGNMNRSEFVTPYTNYATVGKTYVTYVIEWVPEISNSSLGLNDGLPVTTFVYLDSTAAASITAIDDLFLGTDPATDITGLYTIGF